MGTTPKPVTDKIRAEADRSEANQDVVTAAALRQVADEMDNTKNGSVQGPSAPAPQQ